MLEVIDLVKKVSGVDFPVDSRPVVGGSNRGHRRQSAHKVGARLDPSI